MEECGRGRRWGKVVEGADTEDARLRTGEGEEVVVTAGYRAVYGPLTIHETWALRAATKHISGE